MEFSAKQIAAFIQGKSLETKTLRYTFAKIEEGMPEQFLSCQIPNIHLTSTRHNQALSWLIRTSLPSTKLKLL